MDVNVTRARFGRRGFLRGAALGGVGLATAAVIGCGDDDDDDDDSASTAPAPSQPSGGSSSPAPSASSPEPVKTASITIGRTNKVPSLDPNSTALAPTEFYALYDPLTRLDVSGGVEPALAETWEADGTSWVFNLRDAEWSDGQPFTAEDVKFSFEYMGNADNKSALISRVNTVESVDVIDPRTVRINNTKVDPIMPRRAGLPYIQPKHVYEASGSTQLGYSEAMATAPVGTGSYIATNIVQDQTYDFAANPSSWRGNKGFTEAKLNIIAETTTLVSAFETGDLDWIQRPPATEFERIKGFSGVKTGIGPSMGAQHWDFANRLAEGHPANDVRVRRALISAIDVPLIIQAVFSGLGEPAEDQIPGPAVFGYSSGKSPVPYDPDASRALLKEAGFENGFDFQIDSQTTGDTKAYVEACAGFWDDIGLNTQINPLEINIWRDRLYGREQKPWPGAFNAGWIAYLFDASFLYDWYAGAGAYRMWDGPEDPTAKRFDEIYGAALSELDDEKRRGLYGQINDLFSYEGEAAVASTYHAGILEAWYGDKIADYEARLFPDINFDEITPA